MNFLNPLALLGLAAASIPLLLHLLNLRKLKRVDFSTLRFLQELQQTRVRKLKLKQLLLLLLRIALVVFAVLAVARPTIETSLPLLSSAARSSVVVIIDNSGSMEGADQRGQRLRQAQDAAQRVIDALRDGDEVVVLPMVGGNSFRTTGFTRTFSEARTAIDQVVVAGGVSNVNDVLQQATSLFAEAANSHREVYIISDAQVNAFAHRGEAEPTTELETEATVFLVRVGDGASGLEQNLSIDSVDVITKLLQPQRPLELEATIRNGSLADVQGAVVSMAFDGNRVAQRTIDIPAGESRKVVLSAPPQRRGLIAASIELEDDAIDADNTRYVGVTIPKKPKIAVVGSGAGVALAATAVELVGTIADPASVVRLQTVAQLMPQLQTMDVVILLADAWTSAESKSLQQFVERGGGLILFANESAELVSLLQAADLRVDSIITAPPNSNWKVSSVDEQHPLFDGVFKQSTDRQLVESPDVRRIRPATGGYVVANSHGGAFITEGVIGSGRILYVSVGLDGSWGAFGRTGLFAATMVRAVLYSAASGSTNLNSDVNVGVSIPLVGATAGTPSVLVTDVTKLTTPVVPVVLPSNIIVQIPPQPRSGVVKVRTQDSNAIATIAVNSPTTESLLTFFDDAEWEGALKPIVMDPDRIVITSAGTEISTSIQQARTGSELWPLCIVLALLCAVAESLVSRFMAQEGSPEPSA